MRFVYLFFLVISVCVLSGFSYAFTGCQTFTDENLGQTLTLEADINGWVGDCFSLNTTDDSNYLEIDCDNYKIGLAPNIIDSNGNNYRLFNINQDINKITFRNCDINIVNSFAKDNSFSPDYSTFFKSNAEVLNILEILDSNIYLNNQVFLNFDFFDANSLDLNFNGSYFEVRQIPLYWILLSSNLNYLNIYDLNVSYDVDDPAKPMIACYHCNLNTVSFFDSALNIASDNIFFDFSYLITTYQDIYLSFDFNNVDANYLLFKDLNLGLDNVDFFLRIIDSDINYVSFSGDNQVYAKGQGLFWLQGNDDNFIDFNFSNVSFDLNNSTFMEVTGIFNSYTGDILNISSLDDINAHDGSTILVIDYNVDINNINVLDSNIIMQDPNYFLNTIELNTGLDINFNQTVITASNLKEGNLGLFYFEDSNLSHLYLRDLNVITDNLSGYLFAFGLNSEDSYDVNSVGVFNSNFYLDNAGAVIIYDLNGAVDLNFYNSVFDYNVDATVSAFFEVDDTNYNTITFSDLNLDFNSSSNLNSFGVLGNVVEQNLDFDNCILNIYDGSGIILKDVNFVEFDNLDITYTSTDDNFILLRSGYDTNYITFKDSNLNISSDSTFITHEGTTADSLLSFDFNNVDANYLLFKDLDLNITSGNFLQVDTNSEIDSIAIIDSNIYYSANDWLFHILDNKTINNMDFNFSGSYFNVNDVTQSAVYFSTNSAMTANIYDLNLNFNSSGDYLFNPYNSGDTNLNVFNSTINVYQGYLVRLYNQSNILDFNFSGSNVDLNDSSVGFFISSFSGSFSTSNLTATTDVNLIYVINSSFDLNITDSNLTLGDGLIDVNSDSNVKSGLIYNNVVYLDGNTGIYASAGRFNADFNTSLTLNSAKRQVWLIDDSNYVGGNLWLNLDGNNLCTTDNDAPYGICDSNIQLLGSDENYYDHLALIDYSDVDLSPTDIRLSGTQAGTITVYCDVNNLGGLDATSDYNVSFYVDNSLQTTTNVTTDINVGEMNTTSFSWTASAVTYDLNCLVDYNGTDTNSENDNREETFTITSGTDGPVGGSDYDVHLSAVYAGKISKSENVIITSNISKSGSKVVPSSKYKLYVLDKGSKKELYSEDFANFDLPKSIQKTITKADLLKIDLNFLNFIDNEKITFSVEIDVSGDKDKKDNNKTLNVPAEYFDLKLLGSITGKISKINKATITGIVTKVQGTESIDAGTVKLYALEKGEKKEIAQSSFTNSQLPYNFIKEIGLNDLNGKVNLYDATDDSGTLEFVLELSVDGDSDLGNNTKSVYSKIEYLDLKLKEAYLLKGENKIPLTNSGKAEFEIKTNYKLHCLLEHTSINKAGSAKVTFGNKTKPHKINEQILDLGKLNGKQQKTMDYEVNINLLDLMSETEAIDTIISVLGLDIKDPETEKIVEKIIADLKKDQFSVDLDLFLDKILFAGLEDEFELIFTGSDLSDSKFNFNLSYVLESKEGVEDKEKAGKEGSEGSGKETSGDNIVLKPEDIFLLTYKSKLGFGELQTIFVFNGKKEPRKNLNLLVVYNDKNWQFKTDENGKVEFLPEFEGKYRLEVPYPNPKVKGEFEVISGYISTPSDFVELSNNVLTSESSTKTKSYLLYLGIGLLIAIGIVLYFLFRPKKPEQYDFLKTNTNLMYQTTFPSWYLK